MPDANRRGLLVILSSPSGAGKSTLSRKLLEWDETLRFSVSATTRAPRSGEQDGREYYFKTREEFLELVENGGMLEHAEVFGNLYGSPLAPVEEAVAAGRDILFDIDWQGGKQIRASVLADDVVSIFILPPSINELHRRLVSRDQDSAEVVAGRMAQSHAEISHWDEYDYVLINDDLDGCFEALKAALVAARQRLSPSSLASGLVAHVQKLNDEFKELT
ncbi:MAG: guanylate kinase [Rhodobacteraceae bacterium]|nr:guanylate kinase [Paracoccaceae bacterium]